MDGLESNPLKESACRFVLNGKNYVWREPVVAQCRLQRAAILRIGGKGACSVEQQKAALSTDEAAMIGLAYSQEATVDILEFLAEFHPEIRGDQKRIWAALDAGEVSDEELVAIFQIVRDFVAVPFVEAVTKKFLDLASSNNGSQSTESMSSAETTKS